MSTKDRKVIKKGKMWSTYLKNAPLTYTGNCAFSSQLKILFWLMKWWLVWSTVLIPTTKSAFIKIDLMSWCLMAMARVIYESKNYNNFVVSNWKIIVHMNWSWLFFSHLTNQEHFQTIFLEHENNRTTRKIVDK